LEGYYPAGRLLNVRTALQGIILSLSNYGAEFWIFPDRGTSYIGLPAHGLRPLKKLRKGVPQGLEEDRKLPGMAGRPRIPL